MSTNDALSAIRVDILDVVAVEALEHRRGVSGKRLRQVAGVRVPPGGAQVEIDALVPVHLRMSGIFPDERYSVTLRGLLNSSSGSDALHVLGEMARYVRKKMERDPDFDVMSWHEIRDDNVKMSDDVFGLTCLIAGLPEIGMVERGPGSDAGNGGKPNLVWHIPWDVEDFAKCTSVDQLHRRQQEWTNRNRKSNQTAAVLGRIVTKRGAGIPAPVHSFESVEESTSKESGAGDDLGWIRDPKLREIAARDRVVLRRATELDEVKVAIVLAGCVIEAALLDVLEQAAAEASAAAEKVKSKRIVMDERWKRFRPSDVDEWTLHEMIAVCGIDGMRVLSDRTEQAASMVRELRNLVHPRQERNDTATRPLKPGEAEAARGLVEMVLEDVKSWKEANGGVGLTGEGPKVRFPSAGD